MGTDIEFSRDGGVARIAFNRPDKLNSFTRAMHADLREALSQCETDAGIRAVGLTGNGRAFCAGQDLSDRSSAPRAMTDLGALIDPKFNPPVRRFWALPQPFNPPVQGLRARVGRDPRRVLCL